MRHQNIVTSKNQPESVSCSKASNFQIWLSKCGYQIQVTSHVGPWRVTNYSQPIKCVRRNIIYRNSSRNVWNVVNHDADRKNNEPIETDRTIKQQKKQLRQQSVCVSTKKPSQSTILWCRCSWNRRR